MSRVLPPREDVICPDCGQEYCKHCDSACPSIHHDCVVELEALRRAPELREALEGLDEANEDIIWMSGLPCLNPESDGWEGWLKVRDRLNARLARAVLGNDGEPG